MRGKLVMLCTNMQIITISWDILGVFFFFGSACIFFKTLR